MQVKDVYDIIPKSHEIFYFATGSYKLNKKNDSYAFLEDYKKPYRYSRYFQRKLNPPDDENKYTLIRSPTEKEQKSLNEHFKRYPNQQDYLEKAPYFEFEKGDVFQNIRDYVRSSYTRDALVHLHKELTFSKTGKTVLEDRYLMPVESSGFERMVDSLDGNFQWQKIYFDSLQKLYDLDDYYKNELDYKVPVYVGKTKKWQAISDIYGKDEVDKVQVAIGAPLQEQLDLWDEENEAKYIQLPISNENQAKFRDVSQHFEKLDHDYDNIIYERARNQAFESMRNMRYWQLPKSLHHHENHEHNDNHHENH
jgi:hypothetical protein